MVEVARSEPETTLFIDVRELPDGTTLRAVVCIAARARPA
jgi:hypothetical protein